MNGHRRVLLLTVISLLACPVLACGVCPALGVPREPSVATLPATSLPQSVSPPTRIPTPTTMPTPTPQPVLGPVVANHLFASHSSGDPRVWAVLESGKIAQSDDSGQTWVVRYPPLDTAYLSCDELVPAGTGGLYCIEGTHGLRHSVGDNWVEIALPLEDSYHVSGLAADPDGSGRVIAFGGDPRGTDNAWILEGPVGPWRSISSDIDNWATITDLKWVPDYGVWARNSSDTYMRLSEDLNWRAVPHPGLDDVFGMTCWVGADGALYVGECGVTGNFARWTGSGWDLFEYVLDVGEGLYYRNSEGEIVRELACDPGWVLPGKAEYVIDDYGGGWSVFQLRVGTDQWELLPRPDIPERIEINAFAVSGDGLLYVATDMGVYVSHDAGETWNPAPSENSNSGGTPSAPGPGGSQRIVFTAKGEGDIEIYATDSDGRNTTQLTQNNIADTNPACSPGGTRIAFVSWTDNAELFLMNADGSNVTQLTDNDVNDLHPAWSPDATQIAFIHGDDAALDLYVMNIENGSITQIADTPGPDGLPSWSPDGKQIVLSSWGEGTLASFDIKIVDISNGKVTLLTRLEGYDDSPKWSPDGSQVLFDSVVDTEAELYVVNADGSGLTQLTDNDVDDLCGAWSPDGERIAFSSNRNGSFDIFVMTADGTDVVQITDAPGDEFVADWCD